jgi:Ca2+-binding EF-hand superfamily protein
MYGGGGGGLTVSRIAFNKHDKDKSGSISRSEFHDLVGSSFIFYNQMNGKV